MIFVANISFMVTKLLCLAKLRKLTANSGRGNATFFKELNLREALPPLVDFRGTAAPSAPPGSDATEHNKSKLDRL